MNEFSERSDQLFSSLQKTQPFGYAVRSFGPLTIQSSCFIGNTFRSFGSVQAYGSVEASDNYVSSDQKDLYCPFVATFESGNEQTPQCIDSDRDNCGFTQPPTPSPTVDVNPSPVEATAVPTLAVPTTSTAGLDPTATGTTTGQASGSSILHTYSVSVTLIISSLLVVSFTMGC